MGNKKPQRKQPKRKRGRPRKELTDESAKAVVNAMSRGLPREMAARLVGISRRTLDRWLERGRMAHRGRYHDFCAALKKAESYFAGKCVDTIRKIGEGEHASAHKPEWTALAWLLERRFPNLFGRRDRSTVKLKGNTANADPSSRLVIVMGPEKFDKPPPPLPGESPDGE